jgi:subtilisin family serine protease
MGLLLVGFLFIGGNLFAAEDLADAASLEKAQRKVISDGGYARLAAKAETDGTVRLIIHLDMPFTPMGHLQEKDAVVQQDNISVMQSDVVHALSGHKATNVIQFKYTPQMALTVDKAALDALISHLSVLNIHEDVPVPPSLDQSVPRIGAPSLWSQGYTGENVTVAILDTGVDKTHPFLSGAVVSEACYSSTGSNLICQWNSVWPGYALSSTAPGSAMPYGLCERDDCDHGTHVAGIIAGRDNGSFSGVAKEANIIAIQVFSQYYGAVCLPFPGITHCTMSFTSDQMKDLQRVYELRNTYNIASVNMSLGYPFLKYTAYCNDDPLKPSIDNLKSVNIATIISAGNYGYIPTYGIGRPACIQSAVSVGATTDDDAVALYSNNASILSLFAPGSDIYSSIPGGGYVSWSGTSMAAPHVAGTWALLRQARPAATVDQILDALQSTGVPITDPQRPDITKPRIQVDSALNAL